MTDKPHATVVGAGLAGCEAAYQLSKRGIMVSLYEIKPASRLEAHKSDAFCELVCSNSLRSDRLQNSAGLLKEELRRLGSLIIKAADATRIPAGGALAVDREGFSAYVTAVINSDPNINIINQEVTELPKTPAIIATGPLTKGPLFAHIEKELGKSLHFYDAAAPILYKDSLDMDIVFRASRYGRGEDYLNCPLNKEEYFAFYDALINAESVTLKEFETPKVFEGCMPVETMAKRGSMTLAFGPMKPVGLSNNGEEKGGQRHFAVVQLRQDDQADTLYNMVGFQTNLTFAEQRRVFRMIPGLGNAEFARFGVMHRNTFLQSPGLLDERFAVINKKNLYFAGQITGVEGYVESAASGFVAAVNLADELNGRKTPDFTRATAIGALGHYVAGYAGKDFQPMNINFGIMEQLKTRERNKTHRYELIAERALSIVDNLKQYC